MPETSHAILQARRRARDYWDIDGLPALVGGAATVLLGAAFLPPDSHQPWSGAVFVLWFAACVYLVDNKRILEWLKSRITYPRTGYVAPPKAHTHSEPDPYTIISIIKEPEIDELEMAAEGRAGRKALDLPFFLVLAWWFSPFNRWLAFLTCIATASWLWRRNREGPPWYAIAGAAIAGLLSAILTVSNQRRFGIVLIVLGASATVKGVTLLIRYLRQHPATQA